jgi:hypothetical protein
VSSNSSAEPGQPRQRESITTALLLPELTVLATCTYMAALGEVGTEGIEMVRECVSA